DFDERTDARAVADLAAIEVGERGDDHVRAEVDVAELARRGVVGRVRRHAATVTKTGMPDAGRSLALPREARLHSDRRGRRPGGRLGSHAGPALDSDRPRGID